MTSPNLPPNAYTDSPEQHSNLILGSLQLLFWIFFRPSVLLNYFKRIDLDLNSNSGTCRHLQWKNPQLRRFTIQAYLVLPILISLSLGLVLWILGQFIEKTIFCLILGFLFDLVLFISAHLVSKPLNVAFSVLRFGVITVALVTAFGWIFLFGVGMGIALLCLIYAGFLYITDQGIEENARQPKQLIINTYIAIVSLLLYALIMYLLTSKIEIAVPYKAEIVWFGVGLILNLYRSVVLYPFIMVWNTLVYQLDKQKTGQKPNFLRWHSAFWDERQPLPLYGLDKHLILVMEKNPEEGKAAINYLSTSPQRWAAQRTQIEVDARGLEGCTNVKDIRQSHHNLATGELKGPASSILRTFSYTSQDVDVALNQENIYNQRLNLNNVVNNLNKLSQELTKSSEFYAIRFYPIANHWHQIVVNHLETLATETEIPQEIENPYIIGVPLSQQKIFVKPADISGTYISTRIEKLLLDRRHPPLLLYGQRRMGKTSLLNNLGSLLPSTIIPMFVDLQGPVSSASDYAGFLYNIARSMVNSAQRQRKFALPSLDRETLQDDPFTRFDEWLDRVEQKLEQNTALLALDEFEALDNAIAKGRFDEQDVLGMLRHLIQHRPRFKVLLAGSHTIEEFQRWASYLINVQVVHISYLKEPEARQLIERPVNDFTLRYEPNAVDRALQLTRCHPFLIQLLCGEIVALKNEQAPSIRRLATLADIEAAIPAALRAGSLFFADLQNNQIDAAGRALLQFLAAWGEGATVSKQTILQHFPYKYYAIDLLLQREAIEQVNDGYRFQVELIRRWFASSPSV